MTRDITNWCKCCLDCQQSKISRYNKLSPAQFTAPDARFQHIHVDLVGPLPPRDGYRFILSIIDRFSRWPEAIPLRDSTAHTVVQAIFDHWISRFGVPSILTSDQGRQFEYDVFKEFTQLFGIKRIRTTAYHPASNGMVERWHRDLKAALMCRTHTQDWVTSLSTVLLGLRTRIILPEDISPAEMLYGIALCIPGDFIGEINRDDNELNTFKTTFVQHMQNLKPIEATAKSKIKPFYFKDLESCTHVFKAIKAVKPPLTRPFTGPHKVHHKHESRRHFDIIIGNKVRTDSIEHLKPAHLAFGADETHPTPPPEPKVDKTVSNELNQANDQKSVISESLSVEQPVLTPPLTTDQQDPPLIVDQHDHSVLTTDQHDQSAVKTATQLDSPAIVAADLPVASDTKASSSKKLIGKKLTQSRNTTPYVQDTRIFTNQNLHIQQKRQRHIPNILRRKKIL
uniref:Integrase catalytic domain-containing protein n=1 Tax=Trichogramma kaykai TaxID=54128 RepID=A0ABD2VSY0_9HYME